MVLWSVHWLLHFLSSLIIDEYLSLILRTTIVSWQGSQASTSLLPMLWPHCCILLWAPLLRAPLGCCPRNLVLEKVGAQINALIDKLCWKIRINLPPRLTSKVVGYESPNWPLPQRPVHIMYRKRICSVTKRPPDNGVLASTQKLNCMPTCISAQLTTSTPLQQTNVLAGGAIKKPLQEENSWLTGEGTRATSTSVTGRQVSFAAGPS